MDQSNLRQRVSARLEALRVALGTRLARSAQSAGRAGRAASARVGLAATVVSGKIYAIGGSGGSSLNTAEEYDAATNTWTTKAPMPTARVGLAAAVVNGEIYAIGGYIGSSFANTVEEYGNPTLYLHMKN